MTNSLAYVWPIASQRMVTLYSDSPRLIAAVREAVSPAIVNVHVQPIAQRYPDPPDWVITMGQITARPRGLPSAQHHAAQCGAAGAMALPEAGPWLSRKIELGEINVLAGWPPTKNAGVR